jgi:hypothetical protein
VTAAPANALQHHHHQLRTLQGGRCRRHRRCRAHGSIERGAGASLTACELLHRNRSMQSGMGRRPKHDGTLLFLWNPQEPRKVTSAPKLHCNPSYVGVRGPTRRPAQPRPPTTECLPVSYGPGAGGAASPGPPLPMSATSRGVPWLALLVWRGTPMCSLCRRRRRHPHLTTPSSTRSHARVTLEDGLHAPRTHEC